MGDAADASGLSGFAAVAIPTTDRGRLDTVTRDRISGWAAGSDPDAKVLIQLTDDGRPLARVVANAYREDLDAAGIGDGWHAFDVLVPGGLSPLRRHVIRAWRESDGAELVGSPQVIEAAGSFDDALRATVSRAIAAAGSAAERERLLEFLAEQAEALLQQQAEADGGLRARERHGRLLRAGGPAAAPDPPQPRALVIDERCPVAGRDAGSEAVLSHMQALQALGYAVSLVAADDLGGTAPLGITLCRRPAYSSVEEVLRRQEHGFDVVYLHRAGIAARYLQLVRRHQPRARLLYSVADLHHVRLERQAAVEDRPELLAASRALRLLECTAAWSADAVITHSGEEAALLRQLVPEAKVHRAPWSLPLRPVRTAFLERSGVAFVGHFRHEPNRDAARWLVESVMPLVWRTHPSLACLIVGAEPDAPLRRLGGDRVQVLGHVPDLGAVFGQVRLSAAPLRFGAGVKGKVLESFAAGLPCVLSKVAAEGLALPPPLRGLVGEDAEALARMIVALHEDADANAAAGCAALAYVSQEWSEAKVAQAIQAAIGRGPASAVVPGRG